MANDKKPDKTEPDKEKNTTNSTKKTEETKNSEKKEVDKRNENTINTNDFENIDKKYEKKEGLLTHLFSKKNKDTEKKQDKPQNDTEIQKLKKQLDDFSFKLDKIDGRLEAEVGSREAINERITTFAEEIGELRSMILDRERSFNEIQTGFERIETATKTIHPEKIKADFERMEKLITNNTIKVEKTELFLDSTKTEIQKYRTQMNKIKSFDNLSESIDKIKEKVDEINDSKNYIDRKAAKIDTIFSDLNERLKDFNKEKVLIEKIDELTRDLLKSVDSIELKIEESALKEDIDKKLTPVTNSLNENSKNITTILKTVQTHTQKLQTFNPEDVEIIKKDFVGVERILDSLEKRYVTSINEIDTKLNTINNSKKELEKFKNQIKTQLNENTNTDKIVSKLNNLKSNIDTINERINTQYSENMDEKLTNIIKTVQKNTQKLQTFNPKEINIIKKEFEALEENLDSLNENHIKNIKNINTNIKTLTESKKEFSEFKNQIKTQTTKKEEPKNINSKNIDEKITNLEQATLILSNKLSELNKTQTNLQTTTNLTIKNALVPRQKINYLLNTMPIINEKISKQEQLNIAYTKKIELIEILNNNAEKKIRDLTTIIEQNQQHNNYSHIKTIENKKINPIQSFKPNQIINQNKNTNEKPIKSTTIAFTNEEKEIAKQLVLANNMLSEFNLTAAEKQCNQIKNTIAPHIKNTTPSKNILDITKILKELDDFLNIPEKTADNFKLDIIELKERLNENKNNA